MTLKKEVDRIACLLFGNIMKNSGGLFGVVFVVLITMPFNLVVIEEIEVIGDYDLDLTQYGFKGKITLEMESNGYIFYCLDKSCWWLNLKFYPIMEISLDETTSILFRNKRNETSLVTIKLSGFLPIY